MVFHSLSRPVGEDSFEKILFRKNFPFALRESQRDFSSAWCFLLITCVLCKIGCTGAFLTSTIGGAAAMLNTAEIEIRRTVETLLRMSLY